MLEKICSVIGKCPLCNGSVKFTNELESKQGVSYTLLFSCTKCEWKQQFLTSPPAGKAQATSGKLPLDINLRMVHAFREIGKGHKSISSSAANINMLPPMTRANYPDGTWQKRGHSSLNGVVTLLSSKTGKCFDYEVLSKKCKSCEFKSKKQDDPKYNEWKVTHKCQVNHTKSSCSMESVGTVTMFRRSTEKHKLRYTEYIEDGDSSSFLEVKNTQPYGGLDIKKLECIGHVQKHVGTRCSALLKSMKGEK